MRYRTLLVHLDNEHRVERPLRYARALAGGQEAHLIGLTVLPSFTEIPPSEMGTQMLMDEIRASFKNEAARMQSVFEAKAPAQTFTTEWRVADPGFKHPMEAVAEASQGADIIVASQDDPDWQKAGFSDRAGLLVALAPRPVIFVPVSGWPLHVPGRVLVAWNGSREAARALFDALPLLQAAKSVTVLSVRAVDNRECPFIAKQDVDVCETLARHGIKAEWVCEAPSQDDAGLTLLTQVERHAADLLVMGGYGHSRVRERIFGGVTRHILRHMRTPVLMSH